ncbi:MAG: diguanylate cyclase [Aquincola sp.]|nr:diguanylate cyclase [Aquincola sp.]
MIRALLAVIGRALDGLDIGFCAYDPQDRLIHCNQMFMALFPEHAHHISAGEHYSENLRRFYRHRMPDASAATLERCIAEGIARHQSQERPFEFKHRGRRLRVASLALPGVARVRIWRSLSESDAGTATADVGLPDQTAQEIAAGVPFLERLADAMAIVNAEVSLVWVNESFLKLYRLGHAADAVGHTYKDLIDKLWSGQPAAPHADLQSKLDRHLDYAGSTVELELPDQRWIRITEQAPANHLQLRYHLHLEVTAVRRRQSDIDNARQRLREEHKFYELLAHYSSDATLKIEAGRVTYLSPAITSILGWQPVEVLGQRLARLVHPSDRRLLQHAMATAQLAGRGECTVRARRPDGSCVWLEAKARTYVLDQDGTRGHGAVVNVRDVTARKQLDDALEEASARLERLAHADGLTGLANRRKLDQALDQALRPSRVGSVVSLILVDIDFFKRVNDRHGHLVGDALLCRVGAAIADGATQPGELAARYGGEEFALLLPGAGLKEAAARAEWLRSQVQSMEAHPLDTRITVSCGVASVTLGNTAISPVQLLGRADRALYLAKSAGRNVVRVWQKAEDAD